ncbi:MAG: alpha/beta hydrolase [Verrucomicrobiota bacterium]|nr:alpha/beta hydrolase [Verrucomicrobiota bacterium]
MLAASCLGSCVLLLGGCAAFERRPPNPRTSISQTERVTLGALAQTIRIRGDNREKNPVLLFLHGGPGLPEMPVAHRYAELERIFTVVQWDQRGAGKSFRFHTPSVRAEQFVSDTLELSRELRRRFGGRKIYLSGYSWGSLVAARAVAREPDLFAAYIGIGQVVNIPEAEGTLYAEALAEAHRRRLVKAVRDLERAGPPPWEDSADKKLAKRCWKRFAPPLPNKMTPLRFAALAFTSPAYTPLDFVKVPFGAKMSFDRLEDEIYAADLFREVPRIEVPVYFFMGRHDRVVSDAVLARYFRALHAPCGKRLVWFEKSGHVPHLEEPDKFRAVMKEVRGATGT